MPPRRATAKLGTKSKIPVSGNGDKCGNGDVSEDDPDAIEPEAQKKRGLEC